MLADGKFSAATIDAIAEILDAPTPTQRNTIDYRLNDLATFLPTLRTHDGIPNPAARRDELDRLATCCQKELARPGGPRREMILKSLYRVHETGGALLRWQLARIINPSSPERALRDGLADEACRDAMYYRPELMLEVARAAQEQVAKLVRPRRGGARHREDWVAGQVLLLLGALYFEIKRRKPAISVNATTGQPYGPFVDMAFLVFQELGWPKTRVAIRHIFQKVRDQENW